MKKRLSAVVGGRVQGVGFRYFIYRKAKNLKVSGWVKNRPDGKVEALIEGEEVDLEKMAFEFRQGPSGSRVDECELVWKPYTQSFTSFNLVH